MSYIKLRILLIFGHFCLQTTGIQATAIIEIDKDLQLIHLKDSVFIHVSWHELEDFGRFPSNGLLIVKDGKGIMVDTPMDVSKTERLTEYIEEHFHTRLITFIATHYHDDCIGGLPYLHEKGIQSIANSITIEICRELDLPLPENGFNEMHTIDFNDEKIECRYFGGGHSFDNIVVWLPEQKILFGGCMIKSANARNLGNTEDAVLSAWKNTVQKVKEQYPDVAVVIPGHGASGGMELLNHTVELLESNGY